MARFEAATDIVAIVRPVVGIRGVKRIYGVFLQKTCVYFFQMSCHLHRFLEIVDFLFDNGSTEKWRKARDELLHCDPIED